MDGAWSLHLCAVSVASAQELAEPCATSGCSWASSLTRWGWIAFSCRAGAVCTRYNREHSLLNQTPPEEGDNVVGGMAIHDAAAG